MIVYLSLGANLGNREETINKAVELLSEHVGPLIKRSSFFYSRPWGFDSPNDFCNLCASFETALSPLSLLQATQSIERQLGRTTKSHSAAVAPPTAQRSHSEAVSQRNGLTSSSEAVYSDRPIDIDILLVFDDAGKELNINCQLSTVNYLIIPHPLMQKRDFVMHPLQEIAPDLPIFSKK